MLNRFLVRGRHLKLTVGLLALFLCVGCGGAYYTVEGNLNTKYLVIHDGKEEIKIDLSTAKGGNLYDNLDGEGSFNIEVDGVQMTGRVTTLGSVHFSSVIYKGKKLGSGSWNDM